MTRTPKWIICVALITLAALPGPSAALPKDEPLSIRKLIVSEGVELHYVERGTGVPVVFVHGSLSDGGYWSDQVGAFGSNRESPILMWGHCQVAELAIRTSAPPVQKRGSRRSEH